METSHLTYVLDAISHLPRNHYPNGIDVRVYENWLSAVRRFDRKFHVRTNKQGYPYITLLRADNSQLGVIEPVLLPGCPARSRSICNDKTLTADILARKGIRVPRTWTFAPEEGDSAAKTAFAHYPEVAVKAASLSLGTGVFLRVTSDEFASSFARCVALQETKPSPRVLVQEMHPGFEMRATVIEGALHNVVVRIPAYVTGDGSSTIGQLITQKNAERARDGFLAKKKLRRDLNVRMQLQRDNLSLEHIPSKGQRILLSSLSNTSYGGETAVVTHLVSDAIKDAAVRSVAAIPGITTAGCDIMATSFDDEDPTVIEINTFPHMQLSLYPTYGRPVDPFTPFLEAIYTRDGLERTGLVPEERGWELVSSYLKFYALKDSMAVADHILDPSH